MSNYQVLTLKYRPQSLDEIWIQDHIKTTLERAIETNRVAHAYLFTGPRGVGKTTTARILAKSLNCTVGPTIKPCQDCSVCKEITNSSSLDVLEIDGASNRGIDQVRELRENVKFLPSSCPYKIYIIDEVHMLTQEAFNALLKTLEEPPVHVKFIFATTAPQKVPVTILSRCQRFDFRKATVDEIVKRLEWICEKENIKISEDALFAIGKRADGSIRDGEGMLDQLRVYKSDQIGYKDVEELLGMISSERFFEYTDILLAGNSKEAYEFIDKIFQTGYDFVEFYSGLLEHFRLLLMVKLNINRNILSVTHSEIAKYDGQSRKFTVEKLLDIMGHIADNEEMIKRTTEPKILFEILSITFVNGLSSKPNPASLTADKKTDSSSNLRTAWQNFIETFSEKRPYLATYLETAVVTESTDDKIFITLTSKRAKELIDSEKAELELHFSALLNKPMKIIATCEPEEEPKKEDGNNIRLENKETAKSKLSEPRSINDSDKIFRDIFPDGKKIK